MAQLAAMATISDEMAGSSPFGTPFARTRRMAVVMAASTSGSKALWRLQTVELAWVLVR